MIFQYDNSGIYYNVKGKGPALVLLHGFLESSSIWEKFIFPLSEKYTVIIIDLPGHGKSEPITQDHTMEQLATVVNELLISLKISEAYIIGHSMGGYVALALTELFEDKVAKLILLNSSCKPDSPERKENRNRALKLIEKEKQSFLSMAIANLFSDTSRVQYAHEIEKLKKEASLFPLKGIASLIKGMRDRGDRTVILKNFTKEKWILCGTEDPIVPIKISKSIAEETNSNIKIFSGSHMSWLENEDEIVNFLLLID